MSLRDQLRLQSGSMPLDAATAATAGNSAESIAARRAYQQLKMTVHEKIIDRVELDKLQRLTPEQQLTRIRERLLPMIAAENECLLRDLLPQLKAEGIEVASYDSLNQLEKHVLDAYFTEKVFPVLTPLAVDPGHPFCPVRMQAIPSRASCTQLGSEIPLSSMR